MTHQRTRPRRQKLGDSLRSPDASAAEIRIDYAIAPFDRAAIDMDRKWGVDRLPEIVTPETAAKYGSALAKLNAAILANDPAEVELRAGVCIRGLAALDAEAERLGRKPMPAEAWEIEINGRSCAIVREAGDWTTLQAIKPGMTVYTLREIKNALEHYKNALPVVEEIKRQFPGAEISAIRPLTETERDLNDEIVF